MLGGVYVACCIVLRPKGMHDRELQVQVLQQLARDCHTSCQQCLKKRCDMEPLEAAEGAGSESGQLHFQGDAAQWHQLVEQCAPYLYPIILWQHSVVEYSVLCKHMWSVRVACDWCDWL